MMMVKLENDNICFIASLLFFALRKLACIVQVGTLQLPIHTFSFPYTLTCCALAN